MAVREGEDGSLTEGEIGRAGSGPVGSGLVDAAALWDSLQEMRGQFAKLAGAMDNLAALREMNEEAALIEMALLAQGNATLVDTVWQALAECDERARNLGADVAAQGLFASKRTSWVPVANTIPVPFEESPAVVSKLVSKLASRIPPGGVPGEEQDTPAGRSGTHQVEAEQADGGPITQVDIVSEPVDERIDQRVDDPIEELVTELRVLVVDDEPAVLRAFSRVLSQHYEVLTARNGAEALKIVLAEEKIDAIVCDLNMPRLNGGNFFAELRELKPQLLSRVVFCTGTATSHRGERFLKGLQAPVLHKPVAADQLLSVIESVLPGRAEAGGVLTGTIRAL